MSGGFPTATQARSEAAKRSIGESRHLHAMTAVSFVLVSSWPVLARAYRPFNSTDAAVAAKGELEIELGPLGFVKEVQTIVSGLAGVIWRVREVLSLSARTCSRIAAWSSGTRRPMRRRCARLQGRRRHLDGRRRTRTAAARETATG